MSRRKEFLRGLGGAAAALLLTAAPATAAVAPGDVGAGPVAAVDGQPLISVPVEGGYRLALRTAQGDQFLPVRPRGMPFDVDVGPDAQGGTSAVYSRCRREPVLAAGNFNAVAYRTGRDCRLYRYSFADQRESRLRVKTHGSAFLPAIWRDRVVWAQTTNTSTEGGAPAPRLYTQRGEHSPRRLHGGSATDGTAPSEEVPAAGPLSLDLRGNRVVFVWSLLSRVPSCQTETRAGRLVASELWTESVTGENRRRLASAGCPADGASASILDTEATATGSLTLRNFYTDTGYLRSVFEQRAAGGTLTRSTDLPVPTVTTDLPAETFSILTPTAVTAVRADDTGLHLQDYAVPSS